MAQKYLFETFYNKRNKKENNLQIWQYYLGHINFIEIKNRIILIKTKKKEKL